MLGEWISAFWLRIKALVRRRELDRDLEDELAFHLAMREQKLREQGVSAKEESLFAKPTRDSPGVSPGRIDRRFA